MEKLMSPEQIADYLDVKTETVREWIRNRKLKALKVGRLWRIKESELQAFLEGNGKSQRTSKSKRKK